MPIRRFLFPAMDQNAPPGGELCSGKNISQVLINGISVKWKIPHSSVHFLLSCFFFLYVVRHKDECVSAPTAKSNGFPQVRSIASYFYNGLPADRPNPLISAYRTLFGYLHECRLRLKLI